MVKSEWIRKAIKYVKTAGIEVVDLRFTDVHGQWHHLSMPAERLTKEFFVSGEGFDGSSVPGFKTVEKGDMLIIPDPETMRRDVFTTTPTVSFICDIVDATNKKPFSRDPRGVAKKAEAYLKKTKIADTSLWGPEFEFHIFDRVNVINDINISMYEINSEEAFWYEDEEYGNEGYKIAKKKGYHAMPPYDRFFDLRSAMVNVIESIGVKVRYHHHEVGSAGQNEIEILRYPLTAVGDITMWIKYIIKMVSMEEGKVATFMPKPMFGEAGNGMHYHQHLFKNKKPLFYDKKGYAGLSKLALYYIGGILKHGRSLLAITNPSTNSYKRLVPGYEAPVNLFFSQGNRSAAIRIPEYAIEPMEKRIEFRPPDATANAYLAPAAMLMAGIDGIKNKIDPTKEGMGPIDKDILSLSEKERKKIVPVPESLKEAAEALEKDHEYLLNGNVFTEDLIEYLVNRARKEYNEIRNMPHPMEMEKYFGA